MATHNSVHADSIIRLVTITGEDYLREPITYTIDIVNYLNLFLFHENKDKEYYIHLVHDNVILNNISIFDIDDTFVFTENIKILFVIINNKKDRYIQRVPNSSTIYIRYNVGDNYSILLHEFMLKSSTLKNAISYLKKFNYKDMVIKYIKYNKDIDINMIHYIMNFFTDDLDVMLLMIKKYTNTYLLNRDMRQNYYIVLVTIKKQRILRNLNEDLRDNYTIITRAIDYHYGRALRYASKRIQSDYDFVFTVVESYPHALKYADNILKDNQDIVLLAIKKDGITLKYASFRLRNNYNIVLAAVKQNPLALKYASRKLQDNDQIFAAAYRYELLDKIINYASARIKSIVIG